MKKIMLFLAFAFVSYQASADIKISDVNSMSVALFGNHTQALEITVTGHMGETYGNERYDTVQLVFDKATLGDYFDPLYNSCWSLLRQQDVQYNKDLVITVTTMGNSDELRSCGIGPIL